MTLLQVVGKLKTVSVDVAEQSEMKIRWRLDCSDRVGIVTGFRVYYCPVAEPSDSAECAGPHKQVDTKPDKETVWIKDLKPWTYYKVPDQNDSEDED